MIKERQCQFFSFLKIVLPRSNGILRKIVLNRNPGTSYNFKPSYSHSSDQFHEIEWSLARIFEHEILLNKKVQKLKRQLNRKLDFSITALFNHLDQEDFGFIDTESIELFMEDQKMPIS